MTQRFTLEREYDATPERVFSAWTDVSTLSRWFGCADDMLWRIHEWNPSLGGNIHVSLDFEGHPYEVTGTFTIVDPPHRLQYRWSDNEIVDVRIEPRGSGSLVRLEHSWPPTDDDRSMISAGWTSAFARLDRALPASVA
ncbi:MAG TPA: SRPBCC domain-containing protein [Candidatus Cybelea sp.]|jgi:uncharacterized protein YndB with AHSA1/START domain|nr:SRPBCC domain-containing protein [Candidatus Cybelea sp.]